MTDTVASRAKAPGDLRMLAQVEQWLATIREISREELADLDSASLRLERLLAPAPD
jgi:hypothetical protein